jgi:hypothetical protein
MSDLDMALEAFLAAAASHAPDLPTNLLTKIYESQKNHQYEEGADRSASVREMEKLVEEYLDSKPQGNVS